MTVTTFKEHQQYLTEQDPDLFLGRLCWYTIFEMGGATDMCVSHADAVERLKAVGITERPAYPRDHDLFRRVSRDAERKRVPGPVHGTYSNYHLTEVTERNARVIIRRIVKETVDSDGLELDYEQLLDIKFDRDAGMIDTEAADDLQMDVKTAKEIAGNIKDKFRQQQGMLTSYVIREFVRKLLMTNQATCVRSGGGVYFVQEARAELVAAVETFVNSLPNNVGEFHSLPLLDDGKQRDMVRRAFEAESVGAVDKLLLEIKKVKHEGETITQDRYLRMFREYKGLMRKTKEYGSLLEHKLTMTDSRLDVLQAAIVALEDNVKEPKNGS